jgi:hypothetical protein
MPDLRTFTLSARDLLTKEAGEMLQQVYRLDVQTGARLPIPQGHMLQNSAEAKTIRARIEKLLDDEVEAGLKREEAINKLIKETAFTHLNRLVAFKLMEARGLVRSPLARRHEANGFKRCGSGVTRLRRRSIARATARMSVTVLAKHRGTSPTDTFSYGSAVS